jgi:hypothetical protein
MLPAMENAIPENLKIEGDFLEGWGGFVANLNQSFRRMKSDRR